MSKLRIWLYAGVGEGPSQELVAAADGLSASERRRARRLVRRGRVGEDVAVERYAVAFARERQRRHSRIRSFGLLVATCLASGLTCGGLAIYAFTRSQDAKGLVFCGCTAFILIYCLWLPLRERGNLSQAEELGKEFLRRSGAPYLPGGPPSVVYVSPLLTACSLAVQVAICIPLIGVITLLINEESLSPGRALSAAGAHWMDVLVLIFGVLYSRSRNQDDRGRSTPEYQHLRDLE